MHIFPKHSFKCDLMASDDYFAAMPAKSAAVGKICLLRKLWEKELNIKSEKKTKK